MRKRRRLLTTPMKNKAKMAISNKEQSETKDKEVVALQTAARGRLKGALKEALDPAGEDSDASSEHSPTKRERKPSQDFCTKDYQSEEEDKSRRPSPPRQSYVLKLFDRSVDLSQFNEDSPLYPICRAWIANQPKANYKPEDRIELPGPEGPPISRIPDLLPEQKQRSKDNINLNYLLSFDMSIVASGRLVKKRTGEPFLRPLLLFWNFLWFSYSTCDMRKNIRIIGACFNSTSIG
ncbi:hypothetical protein MSG28_010509 [Choristoneura fumiferana]|uniref:Uncharacterized protein n=1 Tax=Choristoneura fumiferana TaxID=7141 RepID=A0ACC0KKX6_CHOFU|nr:hypothetical protein MSG28_010509 [Choristoneura fumiferana]